MTGPTRRILSVWLHRLAIERWNRTSGSAVAPDLPAVLTVDGTHGPLILAASDCARQRGARAGARLADARAMDPDLVAFPADPQGDLDLVHRLAHWAGRWSPLVEVDGTDGLRLDVSGVAHLFGGERRLAADIVERFRHAGLSAKVAIAPTAVAAWALARFSGETISLCDDGIARRLAPLPVAALRLSQAAITTLGRLGLKTVGALSGIERRALARRFRDSDNPVDALDRATGRKPEPLTAIAFAPPPRARLRLKEPVAHPTAAARALDQLIPPLVRQLEDRRLGARRLALSGFRVDASIETASVATTIASRDPDHLHRLLADRVAALDPGFGFDEFALEACVTEPLEAAQPGLVEEKDGSADVARLVDRLSVRLGSGRVRRPLARQSHVPERALAWVEADRGDIGPAAWRNGHARPQRLLDRPEAIAVVYATPEGVPRRFVWRRSVHDIARVEGPERIAPEWWRERSTARLRDYYRVEDDCGRRYWIFREGLVGDGRGGAPSWFLHGLFG